MFTRRDVMVVDPVLSDVSVAYKNSTLINELLLPTFKVGKESGKYYKYDKSGFRRAKSRRAPGGKANEVGMSFTTDSFLTEDHALKEKIPFEIIDQAAEVLDVETDATEFVTGLLQLDKEAELASQMADTAVITNNVTLSGTDQWSDYENSDPIGDINTGITAVQSAIGIRPNTLVFGLAAWNVLISHPDIIDRIKYSQLGVATEELVARLFQVERVLVGGAQYDTAKEGQTVSLGNIWGKHAWAVYVDPTPGQKKLTLGYTFVYGQREVDKWDDIDEKSRYVRASENYDQEFVAVEAAYLMKNVVA